MLLGEEIDESVHLKIKCENVVSVIHKMMNIIINNNNRNIEEMCENFHSSELWWRGDAQKLPTIFLISSNPWLFTLLH